MGDKSQDRPAKAASASDRQGHALDLLRKFSGMAYRCRYDSSRSKEPEENRANDEHLRMIMENTDTLVAILDKNGVYEYVSPSHEKLLGYRPEDIVGKSGFKLIHPDDIAQLNPVLQKGRTGEIDRVKGLAYRVLDKDNNIHYLKGNCDSVRDSQGNLKKIIFVGDDISGLRQSEKALNREKEKFQGLVEELPSGVLLLGSDNRIDYINSKFTEIFGYTRTDLATRQEWLKAFFPNPEYRDQILLAWQDGMTKGHFAGSLSRKSTVTCKDGSEKVVLFFPVILKSKEQLIICQDITREDALEGQFMHSQKLESIGRLASGVAHDFNNLLTTIIGNADFALMDIDETDPSHDLILEIKEAADRATGLTRQLLAFSRKQRTNPEKIDLNEKISNTKKMLRRMIGEDMELELLLEPDISPVKVDAGQLEQVIMNLAVNARDAMPDGGRLTIETAAVELSEDDPISPVELLPGSYVLLSISDTGTGIPREIQQQVFEPFFTTKEKGKGTGLGLSTVYGIIKQNKGNTLIYSEVGQGTTIKIFLPEYAEDDSIKEKRSDKAVTDLHGTETVLLVEDEERVRAMIMKMLSHYGYSVLEAGEGREAMRLFKSHYRPVKLLLTDMIMPGINGLELARSLLKIQPDLKVMCMSGYTDSSLYQQALEEKLSFIHKPFTPQLLAEKIRKLLDE
ncbi:MAG: PAS domain S-box protein [Desulfosudaceae bacterium]